MRNVRPIERDKPVLPSTVVFDDKHSNNNPFTSVDEYEALKESIARIGQTDAVICYYDENEDDYVCGDGRHRVRACEELGINVLVRDIPKDATEQEIALVMLGASNSRNETDTQKAIKAYRSVKKYGLVISDVCKLVGIRRNQVTYVGTIVKYGKEELLEILFQGDKVNIGSEESPKWTASLEVIAKWAKRLYEESRLVRCEERIEWSPDAKIKTEAGKEWYYDKVNTLNVNGIELRMILAEHANFLFRLTEEDK